MTDRPTTQRGGQTKSCANTSRRRLHREVFFAHNGPGPYECVHCHTEVDFDSVAVHHTDEDHDNNDPANLVAMHHGCHRQYHATKRDGESRKQYRPRALPPGAEQAIPYSEVLPHWPADRKK